MAVSSLHRGILIAACISAAACANQVAALKRSNAIRHGAPEPCFGIARAGHNDCKTAANTCAGWSRKEADEGAFIYVPSGTCTRITGGRLAAGALDGTGR